MIFQINNGKNIADVTISGIVEHIPLKEFLDRPLPNKNIVTCPTNAIDIEKVEINKQCIDCGICWVRNMDKISKGADKPDFNSFQKYLLKEKMYFYKWFSLILMDYSGIEIKSRGYSRTKRIPLIIRKKKTLYLVKFIREIADIEKADYELVDQIGLLQEETSEFNKIKIIVVLNDYKKIVERGKVIVSVKDIYNKMMEQGKLNIEEVLR